MTTTEIIEIMKKTNYVRRIGHPEIYIETPFLKQRIGVDMEYCTFENPVNKPVVAENEIGNNPEDSKPLEAVEIEGSFASVGEVKEVLGSPSDATVENLTFKNPRGRPRLNK